MQIFIGAETKNAMINDLKQMNKSARIKSAKIKKANIKSTKIKSANINKTKKR